MRAIFGICVLATILIVSQPAFSQSSNIPSTTTSQSTVTAKTVAYAVVSQSIPDYPTDALGAKLSSFPLVQTTPGKEIESDLTWSPGVILTGEKITFIFQFYDPNTSLTMPPTAYHFVILQNGNEIFSIDGATQQGGDYKYFVFQQAGPVQFEFEKIGGKSYSTQYSTIVYDNPSGIQPAIPVIQPATNPVFSQWDQLAFIGLPIVGVILVVVYAKWGSMFRKKKTESKGNKPAI
jgi:hypothetical protein